MTVAHKVYWPQALQQAGGTVQIGEGTFQHRNQRQTYSVEG